MDRAELRAVLITPNGPNELVVLVTEGASPVSIRRLCERHGFIFVTNGTFFSRRETLGDVIGVDVSKPDVTVSKFFSSSNRSLSEKIGERYFFGIDSSGKIVTGRRKDILPAMLPSFSAFLGGLALLDFSNPAVDVAVARRDRSTFRETFNSTNGRFNRRNAYEGLEGGSSIPRTALGIVVLPDGQEAALLITVGHGRNRGKGVTILELASEFQQLAREIGAQPSKLLLLDGGSSTLSATRRTIKMSASRPTTLVGVRIKRQITSKW